MSLPSSVLDESKVLSNDFEDCPFSIPNFGLTLVGETVQGTPPGVNVLLLFAAVWWLLLRLGEHKGVSFGDDPEDWISVGFVGVVTRLGEVEDPRRTLWGELVVCIAVGITAVRFFPTGVVIVIIDGSFFGLKVSPVLRSLASSSSKSSLWVCGLSADQFKRATLRDLNLKRKNWKEVEVCI